MKEKVKNGRYVEEDKQRVCWYKDGLLHRLDGPAVEYTNGGKEWFINGVQYTEQEFNQWLEKKHLNEKLHQTLDEKSQEKIVKIFNLANQEIDLLNQLTQLKMQLKDELFSTIITKEQNI